LANDLCSLADRGFVFDRFDRLGMFRAEISGIWVGVSVAELNVADAAEPVYVQLSWGVVEIPLSHPNQAQLHQNCSKTT